MKLLTEAYSDFTVHREWGGPRQQLGFGIKDDRRLPVAII
jgi:hypothetical protein